MSLIKLQKLEFPKLKPAYLAALIPTAVAINFAGTAIRQGLGVPLFLDSGGTILVSFIAGPWYGALCAVLQAIVRALLMNPMMIFSFPPTVLVALFYGYAARYGITRNWLGLILIIIISQPFTAAASALVFTYIYGGFSGSALDILSAVFIKSTGKIFAGTFISQNITGLIDKAVLIAVVMAILKALPAQYRVMTPIAKKSAEEENLSL
ncbi:hypothetical protein [Neomoorella thermoacetica]|uniref:hypothetical protein n=1 Tax=Neomoorella thermoacetica TaxID=1525 RepID=UPI0008FB6222|nr:hypothetical protein [Moorella thermoacetica]APC07562.1 hypothetical protein MTJW_03820 [Moorella thermoacetica]OIQ53805.1 hypothetical protein MORE_17830 [Moorella thermoacetica]